PVMGDSSMDEDLIEGEAAETHTADLSHLLRQDQDDEPAFPDEEEESDDWEEEDEQEEETPSTPVDQPVDSADIDEEEDDDDEEDDEAYDDEEEEEEEDDDDFEEEEAMDPDENAYNHPIQLVERAKAFMENDAPESGLNLYREGIKLFPKESSIRFQYAMALLKYKNQRQAAREVLEEILEIDDAHEHAHFVLGELAELEQQYLEARDHYERVAELNQHFPNIYYRLGLLSIQHFDDEVERAAGYFEAAIDADKYNADAHYQYAILLSERLDDPKHSLKHFKQTLKYHKHHPFANYDLAVIYHQLGEPDKAYKYYQRAVLINPELRTPENEEAFKVPQAPEPEEEAPVLAQEAPEAVQPKTIADTLGIVLITGATSGIGKATAIAFAEHNYSLLLTGRREDRLTTLATELHEQYGVPVQTKVFDVRDLDATKEALASLDEDWAQVDILINNAGLAKGFAPIHEGSFEHWETMIDTNIKGLLYMTRLITPGMVARGKGHIINISSSAGKEVYPNGNVYCATKFAVEALTKSMRLDLYKHGLKVSQVSPGHVEETEFAVVRFDGDTEKAKIYEDFQPLKASDVAAAIYYIASQPPHVNIQDIFLMGTQQAGSNFVDRSGRD
ncbi:MAG: SDR family NAD(P)-dependent oxidoreductase, partial [Phaeodactylibacter sp.]|nr:SDR family NAD(P)-dependent oxidoreductase [Phaeodactylibacter sp.]